MSINKELARKLNIGRERQKQIKKLHKQRKRLYKLLDKLDVSLVRTVDFNPMLDAIEYRLQELWGFHLNSSFHKFWLVPKCACPKSDNEERYPYNMGYIKNRNCPIHGE